MNNRAFRPWNRVQENPARSRQDRVIFSHRITYILHVALPVMLRATGGKGLAFGPTQECGSKLCPKSTGHEAPSGGDEVDSHIQRTMVGEIVENVGVSIPKLMVFTFRPEWYDE